MDLVERYLQSVKFWLPAKQKEDIVAELTDDIQAKVEEQEAALGRRLNEGELVAMLKLRGNPFVVANRFLPQRSLIGPLLLPMYWFVLKIVGLCYAAVWLPLLLGPFIGVKMLITAQVEPIFVSFAVVTIVFALIEKWQAQWNIVGDWNPRKLPPLRNPSLVGRTSFAIELAVNLTVLVWLVLNASSRTIRLPGAMVTLAEVWLWLFWGYVALMVANVVLACFNLMRPSWNVSRVVYRLVSDTFGAALFCWLCASNIVSSLVLANGTSARGTEIADSINSCTAKMLPWVVVTGFIIVGCDVYRIVRLKAKGTQVRRELAA